MLPVNFDPDAAAAGASGIYGLPFTPEDSRVVIVPVPFEATTSYGGGTSEGPAAVLEASKQVDLFDHETGRPYAAGIAMLDIPKKVAKWNRDAKELAKPVIEKGGAVDRRTRAAAEKVNAISERMNAWVYDETRALLDANKMAVTLGGDHSVPFGAIRAYAETYPNLGILHFDAHADLRDAYEGFTWSHASIFHNVMTRIDGVRLVQVGVRDLGQSERAMIDGSGGRITTFYDADLAARKDEGVPFAQIADEIVAALPNDVYLSWDIDGLDPTLCPGTGTPVPGGLSWNEAIGLLRAIRRAKKRIVGLDLCEVSPGETEWDANVGARLLYKMIGFALLTQA
ncbi:MAG: agmatinase family protein [Acidobacteria bacterium]|nr:agmatinase family protein [Acidobacteriota bacterium]MBV9478538.1 agmatinase family protein [Acidobacteriota bacterium]